jgi:hypothetical protein
MIPVSQRRVEVSKYGYLPGSSKYEKMPDYVGLCHGFAQELNEDNQMFVVAIVEKEDGSIETPCTALIRFFDPIYTAK